MHSWCETGVAYPVQIIGDYVQHIHREHNHEADHRANLGAAGVSQVIVDTLKIPRHGERYDGSGTGPKNIGRVDAAL